MKAIEFKNVSFKYGNNGSDVLKNVSFSVKEGEYIAVLGHNGSGKSTLARLINGLLIPKSGDVEVYSLNTKESKNLFEIRKLSGLIFQNPDNQAVASIVEDDVAFGPENIGIKREEIGRRIDFALKTTETEEFRYRAVSKLSGGQKQRVAIAGVLAIMPKILILDESTAMLDPRGRKEVNDVIKKLNKEEKMTVITITHYMDEAVNADRIIVLSDGEIIKTGTPQEIFDDSDTLNRAKLDLPRSRYIANELKKRGLPIKDGILTREELAEELCALFARI